MSRVANITAAFIGDISDAEAKYNALVTRAAQGIPVNFNGGGAGPGGTSTLGGQSVTSSAPFPTGASSPNFSFIGSQIAQQISASLAPALQAMTASIPTSSPNWGGYFGGIQNQLAAMTPTSSPNMGVIMQQAMQNAMYPPGASSPNWGYYASIAAGRGGNPPAQPGFFGGGFRRTAIAGAAAIGGINHLATQFTRAQAVDEMMGRGDLDEALQATLSDAQSRRQGLGGIIRSGVAGFGHLVVGPDIDTGYDDDAYEEAARQGLALRRLDRTSLSTAARTRQLGYRTAAVGAGDVARTAIEGQASLDTLTQEQIPQREQVTSLRNNNLGAEANQLERTLNAQIDAAKKLADAQNREAERLRGITVTSLVAGGQTGLLAASGFTTLAERQSIIDRGVAEVAKERDPLRQAALRGVLNADVSAFDIGTAREFGFSADDAESRAGISRLRANRDTFGAERAGVESRRRVAMRGLPQNWFTDLLGGRRLRGALNDDFDAQLGEIGAREDFENGTTQRGISGRNASLQFLLDRQPLRARLSSIESERDQAIRQLRPDQEYMEGGIRTGARRESELARREDTENRALLNLRLSSATAEIMQQFARNPLGAQILSNQTDTAEQVARLVGQGNLPAAGRAMVLGFARTGALQRQFGDVADRANLHLGGQREGLQAMLRHDPFGASLAGVVTSGLDEANQFGIHGMRDQQMSALQNTMLQIQLTKQQMAESFHATEIGQNFDTGSPRGQASLAQMMKDLVDAATKIETAIKAATSAK